jgi:glycosyltransferase involved in cell wall biosynthesis
MNGPLVAVYRDRLLPYAQRFIAAQLGGLRRHRALFVGSRVVDASQLPPGARTLTPSSRLGALCMQARLGVPRELVQRLREERPVLLHAQFGTDGVWSEPLARALGVPQLVTFRGFDIARHERSSVPYWVYSRLRRRLYRRAWAVIAVCGYLKERLVGSGCPPEKVEVIYNGIDPEQFRPDPAVERDSTVLFVGRLVEKKGVDTLLRAMAGVQKRRREARLVLIGDGPERPRIESLARAEGVTLELLGRQPPHAVRAWMNRARLLCLPSRTARNGDAEGLPNVILESQCMRLPVVSTRHAGIPEAVDDGTTGLLAPENDAAALAQRILALLEDQALWRRLAEAARRSVEASFDSRAHVARLEALYERAARASAART